MGTETGPGTGEALAMTDEAAFLRIIRSRPEDDLSRLVFADWLEEQGDPRADFLRLHLALSAAAPDHPDRVAGEHELSSLRKGCDAAWLAVIEPERIPHTDDPTEGRVCECFYIGYGQRKRRRPYLHAESQDTECDAWKRLLDVVEDAAADGREEFAPLRELSEPERSQILTLPPTVAKLKAVKTLYLYGTYLIRLPPEVGEMTSLETFHPYTSYRLHWFPYELTRCRNLRKSTVSTRALYGNYKFRAPFPSLDLGADTVPGRKEPARLHLTQRAGSATRPCSVCGCPFEDRRRHRVWVSLPVATDVLPLLVNACSDECVRRLPTPPEGYVRVPHRGGERVQQPPPR
jgi:uncharacterized protein (TIGR02996 family)